MGKYQQRRRRSAASTQDCQPGAAHGQHPAAQLDRHQRQPRVDCDLLNFTPNGECGTFRSSPARSPNRTPRDSDETRSALDAAGNRSVSRRSQCGRTEQGITGPSRRTATSTASRWSDGWGRRRAEWQFGLGIQHEILPRLVRGVRLQPPVLQQHSGVNDQLGIGCDRFNGAQAVRACQDGNARLHEPVVRLLHGDRSDRSAASRTAAATRSSASTTSRRRLPFGTPTVQTFMDERKYTWNGVDTNFNWRGPQGHSRSGRHEHRPHAA